MPNEKPKRQPIAMSELVGVEWLSATQAHRRFNQLTPEEWRGLAYEGEIVWRYRGPARKQILLKVESCQAYLDRNSTANSDYLGRPNPDLIADTLEIARARCIAAKVGHPSFPDAQSRLTKYCRDNGVDMDDVILFVREHETSVTH